MAVVLGRRVVVLMVFLWGLSSLGWVSGARLASSSKQKLQVQKHLNRLNKSPVKTIQVNFISLSLCLPLLAAMLVVLWVECTRFANHSAISCYFVLDLGGL